MATDNFPSDGGTKVPNHAFELPKNLDKFLDGVMLRGGAQLASLSEHWKITAKNPLADSCVTRSWKYGKLKFTHNVGDALTFHRAPKQLGDAYDKFVQIAVIRTGTITTIQRGRRRELGANSVMTHLLDEEFFSIASDGLDVILFYVQRSYLESRGIDTSLMAGVAMKNVSACESLRALVELAFNLQNRGEGIQQGFVERALLELLAGIGAKFTRDFAMKDDASAALRHQVMNFIDSNYGDPNISVDSMAKTMGFSRRHIYRLFEGSELSISKMVKNRRLDRAELLLGLPSKKSVSMVAEECGFGGPDQLARAFRERHACSPLEYRTQMGR